MACLACLQLWKYWVKKCFQKESCSVSTLQQYLYYNILPNFLKTATFETNFSHKALCHESAMCSGNRYCLVSCRNVGLLDFRHVKKIGRRQLDKKLLWPKIKQMTSDSQPSFRTILLCYDGKDSRYQKEKNINYTCSLLGNNNTCYILPFLYDCPVCRMDC